MRVWKFWVNFVWDCKTFVFPITILIVACLVLAQAGHGDLAGRVSNLGTALILLGNVVYIVLFHSRKKWPGVPWHRRLVRFLTFHR